MTFNAFLLVFAIAFMGCVLVTPLVTRVAAWAGAIDRPDQFRRIHKGATPRMGGLGLAFGLAISILPVALGFEWPNWVGQDEWWSRQWSVILAAAVVLIVGLVDDSRGMGPRWKLLGQALAVVVLYVGGIRIEQFIFLGQTIDFCHPAVSFGVGGFTVCPLSLLVTLVWFLGCMNVWNLIDGMDGLASGVGLLVSATLMLIAIHQNNIGSALMAAALAGSLAGFLLYNWHPAVIFLGDTGSLLIGLLIGVIGIQDSLKGASALSILFPLLAMGLPISDTAMAIFRRWVRNLPLSSADRRHIHHLLIGLGLNPRQAAVLLYCFTGFLCGAVLLGVAWNNEYLALALGASGCLAFLIILYSRRDELASLRAEFTARMARGRQERFAAKVTWEAIQRIELCDDPARIWEIVRDTSQSLGCDGLRLSCHRQGRTVLEHACLPGVDPEFGQSVSGPMATFRLSSGQDLLLAVSLHQADDSPLAADIAFRFLQRLSLATAERLERLLAAETIDLPVAGQPGSPTAPAPDALAMGDERRPETARALIVHRAGGAKPPIGWLRWALGWGA